jgi:hypothetical protein
MIWRDAEDGHVAKVIDSCLGECLGRKGFPVSHDRPRAQFGDRLIDKRSLCVWFYT